MNLNQKLSLTLTTSLVLVLSFCLAILFYFQQEHNISKIKQQTLSLIKLQEAHLDQLSQDWFSLVDSLAHAPSFQEYLKAKAKGRIDPAVKEEVEELFLSVSNARPDLIRYVRFLNQLGDEEILIVNQQVVEDYKNRQNRPYFSEVVNKTPYRLSDPFYRINPDYIGLDIGMPVALGTKTLGVLTITFRLNQLDEVFQSFLIKGLIDEFVVTDLKGQYLFDSTGNKGMGRNGVKGEKIQELIGTGQTNAVYLEDQETILGYGTFKPMALRFLLVTNGVTITENLQEVLQSILLVLILGGVVIILTSIQATKRVVTEPLDSFQAIAKDIGSGHFENAAALKPYTAKKDEIGVLARTISNMSGEIQMKMADLTRLNLTGIQLSKVGDRASVARVTLEALTERLQAKTGLYYIFEPKSNRLRLERSTEEEELLHPKGIAPNEGVFALIFDELQPMHLKGDDLSQPPDPNARHLLYLAPMVMEGELFGIVVLAWDSGKEPLDLAEENYVHTLTRMSMNYLNNLQNLELIEEQKSNLEERVKSRTAAIKDLMDNTGQGFLSFGPDYRINEEYSKAVEQFLQEEVAGKDALKLLFSERLDDVAKLMDMVFNHAIGLEVVADIMPKELIRKERILSLEYRWISNPKEQGGDRIMIIITDITQERELEELVRADEEKNLILGKVMNDKRGFFKFLKDLELQIAKSLVILCQWDDFDIKALFRAIHTIKGNTAIYGLRSISDEANEIEEILNEIVEGKRLFSDEELNTLRERMGRMIQLSKDYLHNLKHVIQPKDYLEAAQLYQVSEEKFQALEEAAKSSRSKKLKSAIQDIKRQPIRPLFEKLKDHALALAERLDKPIDVRIEGGEVELWQEPYEPLFSNLIHLMRNLLDHGIESQEERMQEGKSYMGRIGLKAERDKEGVHLTLSDDGRGIDAEKLRKNAVKKGLLKEEEAHTLSDEESYALIFHSGLSTKESVSDISGRGVGMDAIDVALKEIGGRMSIQSEPLKGSSFRITLPEA